MKVFKRTFQNPLVFFLLCLSKFESNALLNYREKTKRKDKPFMMVGLLSQSSPVWLTGSG